MAKAIYYGKQTIDQRDIDAVCEVLHSNLLTQGPYVGRFERDLANYVEAPYAVACSNGTAGLHLACMGLGITQGDEVWVSAVSFVASANCARYCLANVRFVDIDPMTGNISIKALEKMLAHTEHLPKALIVVHMGGNSCDMRAIAQLCQAHSIAIIEDACHALGSTYHNEPVGNCRYSDCCVFSFHPVKTITTAEGGMVTCKDPKLAKQLRQFASHGISKDIDDWSHPDPAPWYYEQHTLGYNYRLSDLQAALGIAQLHRIDSFLQERRAIIERYEQAFANHGLLHMQQITANSCSAYHLALIQCADKNIRQKIYQALAEDHIFCQLHYIPIYRQPYYRKLNSTEFNEYPGAEAHYQQALSLPVYPTLSIDEQKRIIKVIEQTLRPYLQLAN
ncbi:UDP-4-amino-4,6-dideoxy-N-acetyl-beta-L-altrosamine transaminase [Celerinatantimonas diazotrophica]|uniref:UDP-4-amino-4, 6-dideoxy-N-acetyl-beta-L-altrosamine transaminase n=1 Tax=Celerinatantimonas diazotrophica TaxID=412034 RepID=A0A4R1JM69_9GAMM|nr:UDP-4-amino-4,6-dideoxy-N-acetyl-beta-L-altrosamine transaminase [Celerinatantimonas diazotrophica]TCK52156.1 UDP-4-amino-4,6-dideoxy-N-acetyl-beta-L-altrosamine transaminase [Celerinatantimonas diazotrophica]CAG9296139.1 UDP-4-amino-4, 6-dideoxy-N-acetyl-beta-L-altrosamine transaminase [Celerinatantimonas diazotrophica]